jgi:phage replication O-like protein O
MPGFTKVDNPLLERVITSRFTKRQLKILLLVIRFSFGYQKTYALLRKNDFSYAGVSPSCIKDELKKLVRMRVLGWDTKKDTFWLNPDLRDWGVEDPVDSRWRFFKIATKNSPEWQLSICRNGNLPVAKTGTVDRERETKTNKARDNNFLIALQDYFLKVAPLAPEGVYIFKQALDKYGSRAVQEAIARLSSGSDRSLSHFLKTLDGIASTTRHGRLSSLRSGLEKYVKMLRRP